MSKMVRDIQKIKIAKEKNQEKKNKKKDKSKE